MTTSSTNQAELNPNKPNIEKSKKLSEWQKFANEGYTFLNKGNYSLASEKLNTTQWFGIIKSLGMPINSKS